MHHDCSPKPKYLEDGRTRVYRGPNSTSTDGLSQWFEPLIDGLQVASPSYKYSILWPMPMLLDKTFSERMLVGDLRSSPEKASLLKERSSSPKRRGTK